MKIAYPRILLKLSGEALTAEKGSGIDPAVLSFVAREIKPVRDAGVQIAIVLGGGNIFRGLAGAAAGIDRTTGDSVGMLATTINSLLLRDALRREGVAAAVLTAVSMDKIADLFTVERATTLMSQGTVVIIAGGTGNPFFTTDTAAALRCAETGCAVLLKATKVDGIYDSDPMTNPAAVKLPRITHREALDRNLRIMDATAFSLCMDNGIPIIVFKMLQPGGLSACVSGQTVGSIVTKE